MPTPNLNIPNAEPLHTARLLREASSGNASPAANQAERAERDQARAFAERLGQFQRAEDSEGDPARNTAKELIAKGLVAPMLKMARESAFKTSMFHGGQGEKAFGGQLDQRLARKVADHVAPELVEAVYQKINGMKTQQADPASQPGNAQQAASANGTGDTATKKPAPATAPATGKEVDRHG